MISASTIRVQLHLDLDLRAAAQVLRTLTENKTYYDERNKIEIQAYGSDLAGADPTPQPFGYPE